MKKYFIAILSAIIALPAFQSAYSQENNVSKPKNGHAAEKSGELNAEGNYISGQKDGTRLTYFPTGLLNKVEQYKDG